ncbi:MAG: PilT/PilU family type 4a pilus ATPase [Endozoicomonas sp.]
MIPISKSPLSSQQVHSSFQNLMGDQHYQEFQKTHEHNYVIQTSASGRFRISAFFQKGEPGMMIRRIHYHIASSQELGVPNIFTDLILKKCGLILITGPAGAGKSTSMASLVKHRNQEGQGHIITVEDPIEFIHEHNNCIITQREVGIDTESYEEGLANTLRQAPDLIVIGEIRSTQAMKHTLEFVQTGHLVIATLHANTAYQALDRVINFFPHDQHQEILLSLSLSLLGILGQQMISTKGGSNSCVAHEILLNSPTLAKLIRKGAIDKIPELMARSKDLGMETIDQCVFGLYKNGQITAEQAIQHADSSNNMCLMIKMDGHKGNENVNQLRLADD